MPSHDLIDHYAHRLQEWNQAHLLRRRRQVTPLDGARVRVDGRELLAFCSNDYLGLAQHPALIEAARRAALMYGVGATASPLVCGHSPAHEALEEELAAFVGLPRAIYFYAGYAANTGAIPALVGKGDAVFSDALNHACLIDGARLSGAERHIYPHLDLAALEAALEGCEAQRKLVISDAVFSMDGTLAPVPELLALCERFDALLMIDDAHGFGVLGPRGQGTLAHFDLPPEPRLLYMATLGKAAGASGAFIAGHPVLVDWIRQRARTYMFATGAPAMVAEALRASVGVIAQESWRREHLLRLRAALTAGLAGLPWAVPRSDSAIQPVIVGCNAQTLDLMARLEALGFWVPAIRPPTVPAGTARLRVSLSAAHTLEDVEQLTCVFHQLARLS